MKAILQTLAAAAIGGAAAAISQSNATNLKGNGVAAATGAAIAVLAFLTKSPTQK